MLTISICDVNFIDHEHYLHGILHEDLVHLNYIYRYDPYLQMLALEAMLGLGNLGFQGDPGQLNERMRKI